MDHADPKRPARHPTSPIALPATEDTAEPEGQFPADVDTTPDGHQGGTESEVGDTTGPGAGYDDEPKKEPDKGGVAPS